MMNKTVRLKNKKIEMDLFFIEIINNIKIKTMFRPEFIINKEIIEQLNPNAIPLLEKNLNKVDWYSFIVLTNAMPILERNKYHWNFLYVNPNIIHLLVKLDIEKMRKKCESFAEELAEYVFHPTRSQRIADQYGYDMVEYFDLI